jgi:hypothetical protein
MDSHVKESGMDGLWLFFLAVTGPMLFWLGYLALSWWNSVMEPRRDAARAAEILAFRNRYVGMTGGSDPVALEKLGDALRSAGHPRQALAAYEDARKSGSQSPGLEMKIRLAGLDSDPNRFGMTLATRDIVCPLCRNLASPGILRCTHCGEPLPVDTIRDAWNDGPFRALILTDARSFAIQLLVVGIAVGCAFATRDPAMIAAILLAAFGVVLFLILRRISNPG